MLKEHKTKDDLPVVIGISGASGSILAEVAVEKTLAKGVPVILTMSSAARMVWKQEMKVSFGETLERWTDSDNFQYYSIGDLQAPIASGTFPTRGMAIIPCSMSTVASIRCGISDNLLKRGADVMLKEKRPLVIVPRETPLTEIHLENLMVLARMGATIIPPVPPFYLGIQKINDMAEYIGERVLLALGLIDVLPQNMQYEGDE
jgi:4-hydroxy-3-polyprenylbenzoate decarboxylase